MAEQKKMPRSWRGVATLDQAKEHIDFGVLLTWREVRNLRRSLGDEVEAEVIRHFARRLVERANGRLQAEMTVESVMLWLTSAGSEKLLHTFLEELFAQPGCDDACWVLVELALTAEPAETDHGGAMFEMAVAMICELGLSLQEYNKAFPGEFNRANQLLEYIATYLLSVSNANSICIRLSLLHYFGVFEHELSHKNYLNRVMGRFGHTVLDHLFTLLFTKRSEAVALQFLVENLPFILEADNSTQKIVHETFKNYMLKHPDRFSLFAQTFAEALANNDDGSFANASKVYLQHLAAMLRVVSNVNHKTLARELIVAVIKFKKSHNFADVIQSLRLDPEMRQPLLASLEKHLSDKPVESSSAEKVVEIRLSRRGRRPAFSRSEGLGTMNQVTYLGGIEIQRAS